jgi:hypothetical protein
LLLCGRNSNGQQDKQCREFSGALTKNGCRIKARLGLHEAGDNACANDGLIVLQPCGEKEEVEQLVEELNKLEGITAKLIDLN